METTEPEVWEPQQRTSRQGHVLIKREERERLLELYDRSGQSQVDFAREQGINYNTLVGWLYHRRKGIAGKGRAHPGKLRFQELSIAHAGRGAVALLLRLPGGLELEIAHAQAVPVAVQLVRELQRCSD
jgi:transposase-like protein